jgi:hypothetical protein
VLVDEARTVARDWVRSEVAGQDWFRGAFLTGSALAADAGAEHPATSDVDVAVLVAGEVAPPKLGKFGARGVLLEVTYLPGTLLADADTLARDHALAPSFRTAAGILADPTGRLHELVTLIGPGFAGPPATRLRCRSVLDKQATGLAAAEPAASWHEQVSSWMFPTSLSAVAVLVAALRTPTVRTRYLAARRVLHEHGAGDVHAELLAHLGCAGCPPELVARHLDSCEEIFDAAAAVAATPLFFRSDISSAARPIAIDGSRALVAAGDHREAVFWVVATMSRCLSILAADGPGELWAAADVRFRTATADLLGVATPDDLRARAAATTRFRPRLRHCLEAIIAARGGEVAATVVRS